MHHALSLHGAAAHVDFQIQTSVVSIKSALQELRILCDQALSIDDVLRTVIRFRDRTVPETLLARAPEEVRWPLCYV